MHAQQYVSQKIELQTREAALRRAIALLNSWMDRAPLHSYALLFRPKRQLNKTVPSRK